MKRTQHVNQYYTKVLVQIGSRTTEIVKLEDQREREKKSGRRTQTINKHQCSRDFTLYSPTSPSRSPCGLTGRSRTPSDQRSEQREVRK